MPLRTRQFANPVCNRYDGLACRPRRTGALCDERRAGRCTRSPPAPRHPDSDPPAGRRPGRRDALPEGRGRGGGEGAIARQCITRHHAHHYLGFAANQWKLFLKQTQPRVKPLLYVYRVLLTGIHLMRTGEVEANLVRLSEQFGLPFLADLIARKVAGPEHSALGEADIPFHQGQYERLTRALEEAYEATALPANPAGRDALHDLLVRLRLQSLR